MSDEESSESPRPYAAWSSIGFGLVALALGLWVLLRDDPFVALTKEPPRDDPFMIAALVHGILGTLASIVALARREPRRLAVLGLVVSLAAVLAKFVLIALVIAVVIALLLGMLGVLG
ncbi:MAG: hypothetical protein AAGF11_14035 [Myxococcota bacterium]